jgi:hypothetical protein
MKLIHMTVDRPKGSELELAPIKQIRRASSTSVTTKQDRARIESRPDRDCGHRRRDGIAFPTNIRIKYEVLYNIGRLAPSPPRCFAEKEWDEGRALPPNESAYDRI